MPAPSGESQGSAVRRDPPSFNQIAGGHHGNCFKRASRMPRSSFEQLHTFLCGTGKRSKKGPNGPIETRFRGAPLSKKPCAHGRSKRKANARRSLSSIRKKLDLLLNIQIVRNCMIILDASAGDIRSKCLSHGATTSKFTQDLNIYGEQMNQNGRESPRTMIFYVHALLLSIL